MDRFAKQFGLRVKRARTERGLTQSELASLAAVGANYVPRIERGEMTPSVDAAFRLAQALGVSVDALCSPSNRVDPVQDAARAVVSLTDGEVNGFRRALQAVEVLRASLRGGKPPRDTGDGAANEHPRRGSKVDEPAAAPRPERAERSRTNGGRSGNGRSSDGARRLAK